MSTYQAVREFFIHYIDKNKYKIGDRLPSENELAKILWLWKHEPHTCRRVHRWATFEDYILQQLGAGTFVSSSMAARTMLFDIHRKIWSPDILATGAAACSGWRRSSS